LVAGELPFKVVVVPGRLADQGGIGESQSCLLLIRGLAYFLEGGRLSVPTAFFKLHYGLVILRHDRRLLVGFGVTAHPTAEWIAQQVTEAFP
jgi:hypothetical protein